MNTKLLSFMLIFTFILTACSPASKHYTAESIMEKYDIPEKRVKEDDFYGIKCTRINCLYSKAKTDYDNLSFCIFSSEAEAKRAFKKSAGIFRDFEDSGDNFYKGWLAGVCDADILAYEYLTGNMIIYTELAVIGCWGTAEELAGQPGPDYEYIDHIIELINKEF